MTALAPAPFMAPVMPAFGGTDHRSSFAGISLDEARHRVEQDDVGKWDVTVLRRHITARNGEFEFPLDIGQEDPMYERLAPTAHAFGQVCTKLGVPAAYLRKCPLVLQDQNLNFWLKEGGTSKPGFDTEFEADERTESPRSRKRNSRPKAGEEDEKWMLRARHGSLRAALSESYSPLDNSVLTDVLIPALPDGYRAQWLGLTDESFHLRITDPRKPLALLPGDDFFAGVHVANSEIGMRSVTVDAVLYRLVCSNGLIAPVKGRSLFQRRHIGIARPRLRAALEEAVSQAFGAVEELMANLRSASQVRVEEPEEAIDRLARTWSLSEQTAEIAKAALASEPGAHQHTAYGLINAFTNAAQTLRDDRRYDLEVLAGRLAEKPDRIFSLSPAERRLTEGSGRGTNAEEEDAIDYALRSFGGGITASLPRDVLLRGAA